MAREKTQKAIPHHAHHTHHHNPKPSTQELEMAAYYRWLERGAPSGGDGNEDWFEVENRWRDNIVPWNND